MHLKRQKMPRNWPVARKGTKYLIRPSHNKKEGIPLLIILREVLKLAKTRKEVKKILILQKVKLNDKIIKKEEISALPFSILEIGNKKYEVGFTEKGKLSIEETDKKERILRVIGKKILKNKKIQLNLLYGDNILYDKKIKIGDSVVLQDKKIVKIISLDKAKEAIIISGKYKGKKGSIEKIEKNMIVIVSNKEKLNVPIKNIIALK